MKAEKTPKIMQIISEEKIRQRVRELGKKISDDYAGKQPTILILTNGGIFFGVDLLRELKNIPARIECVRVSSYKSGTRSSGNPEIFGTLEPDDFADRDILIIDDIIDTGRTLKRIRDQVENFGAKSVRTCAFLDKPARREVNFYADYTGYEIDDVFVVGYGLDYAGSFRELPFVGKIC